MKNYKRLTDKSYTKTIGMAEHDKVFNKAVLTQAWSIENELESGELCDREELIEHLMTAKDTSTLTDKEIEFFIKHNEEVRKETARAILKSMLNKMYKLTGCGVPYHVKKFIEEIAMEYGIKLEDEE